MNLHPSTSHPMASLLVPPLSHRRQIVLDDVWTSFPSMDTMNFLVSNYFLKASWAWNCAFVPLVYCMNNSDEALMAVIHQPTFLEEYAAFTQLVLQNRHNEIDPLFLSLLLMILCLSVNSLESTVITPLVTLTEDDLLTLPGKLFEASQSALESGDWTGQPKIRTLQTIVLFSPFLLFSGTTVKGERHQTCSSIV